MVGGTGVYYPVGHELRQPTRDCRSQSLNHNVEGGD
jgi:hypothetical protein